MNELQQSLAQSKHTQRLTQVEIERFYEGRHFLHHKFGDFILKNDKIKRIDDKLHIFDGKVYVCGNKVIENKMIGYIPFLKDSQRKEVIKYLEIMCLEDTSTELYSRYIAFNNGVYDLEEDKLIPFSDELILTNLIPHNFNTLAYSEQVDNVLNKLACNDVEIRALLEETVGYTFYRRPEMSKAFFFVGEKSNGKSTYLTMIERTLGTKNYTSLGLEELKEKFYKIMLQGKLACIGDDINDEALQGSIVNLFKKMVSGNSTIAENKGIDAIKFKPYSKFFFSCNNIPMVDDPTGAMLRRMVIIPMNARFTKDDKDYDPFIISKLTTEMSIEYFIQLGIAGLKRVLKNNSFTTPQSSIIELERYEEETNTVVQFINAYGSDILSNKSIADVYDDYSIYCKENKLKRDTRYKFTRTICTKCKMTSKSVRIDGKVVRSFVLLDSE